MNERFVAMVREDEITFSDDEEALRPAMYHIWSMGLDEKGGRPVTTESDIAIDRIEIDGIKLIRALGWAVK